MAGPKSRSILGMIFKNFINSFKFKEVYGKLKGADYLGNKYYEIPANPSEGKRRASRWFVPEVKDDFEQEMPAEWESWLRGRRNEPPTDEEVMKNYAIMQVKKKNAIEVNKKSGKLTPMLKGAETFPKRPEYEVTPGKPINRKT